MIQRLQILKSRRAIALIAAVASGAAMIGLSIAPPKAEAKIGKPAPKFTLVDVQGVEHTLSDYTEQGQIVVLEWFNPDCPFVKKYYRDDTGTMNALASEFKDKGVTWLRVNSAREGHPTTGQARMARAIEQFKLQTPILLDYSGKVGRTYGAKRTPELYVIDAQGVLRYHGAMCSDKDRGAMNIGDEIYVRSALEAILAGETIATTETKAYGCSIKYARP